VKTRDGERGAALIVVLLLSVAALIATAGILFMVAKGNYIMGQQRRYSSSLEAAKGGLPAMAKVIATRGADNVLFTAAADFRMVFFSNGMTTKLNNPTASWGGLSSSVVINPADSATVDMVFEVGDYRFYSKIVDTVQGNSGLDEGLSKQGVALSGQGEVTVMSMPYLYTIEVLAQGTRNPQERARLSVLYEY
jgi:hypothetical protein